MDRFWNRVDKSPNCWIWTGALRKDGYGEIKIGATMVKTHRFAWELTYGPIPKGLLVCHKCDNPACCNPDHLFLGTHADNMRDMANKGRAASGAKNSSTKLTDEQVDEIRKLADTGMKKKEIAARYGIHPEYVRMLQNHQKRA